MEERKELEPVLKEKIRLDIIFNTLIKNWKKFILPVFSTALLTALLSLCVPRFYTVQVMMVPEYNNGGSGLSSSLGGVASMFGVNVGNAGSDAISPMFYPDLIRSTDFLVPLLYVQVTTKDSSFTGSYCEYLRNHQKAPFWSTIPHKIMSLFKSHDGVDLLSDANYRVNPYALTLDEFNMVNGILGSISCSVDKKTEVITMATTAQDPLVAALLADTVKTRLQKFITEYRTSKARNDLQHVTKLCEEASDTYNEAQRKYAQYVDSHRDLSLQSYKVMEEKLSNEMNLALNALNALLQQKLMAQAKVQERTPAFTPLQNVSVPVRHAGPKRMMNVIVFTFISFVVTAFVLVVRRKE